MGANLPKLYRKERAALRGVSKHQCPHWSKYRSTSKCQWLSPTLHWASKSPLVWLLFCKRCRLSSLSSPWGPLSFLRWYLVGFDTDSKSPIHKTRWMMDRNPGWCSEVESGLELISSAPTPASQFTWHMLPSDHFPQPWKLPTLFSPGPDPGYTLRHCPYHLLISNNETW